MLRFNSPTTLTSVVNRKKLTVTATAKVVSTGCFTTRKRFSLSSIFSSALVLCCLLLLAFGWGQANTLDAQSNMLSSPSLVVVCSLSQTHKHCKKWSCPSPAVQHAISGDAYADGSVYCKYGERHLTAFITLLRRHLRPARDTAGDAGLHQMMVYSRLEEMFSSFFLPSFASFFPCCVCLPIFV